MLNLDKPGQNLAPILKWVGGKRRLVEKLMIDRAEITGRYFEPFLGGAAVLLSMGSGIRKFGNDSNAELINTYTSIRDKFDSVRELLESFDHSKEQYYEIRQMDRSPDWPNEDEALKAARFLYLNKFSFNGIYRVNATGHFNVPYGGQPNRKFDYDALREFSSFLNLRDAKEEFETEFSVSDFYDFTIEKNPGAGDFVYLDPPYSSAPGINSFVAYNKGGFGSEQQEKVFLLAEIINRNGARFAISNAATQEIEDLVGVFKSRGVPLQTRYLNVQRNISGLASGRSTVQEIVITNY